MSPLFAQLTAWKRRGLAMLLGVFATLALPPFYILILLVPSFAGLFLLIADAKSPKQAFSDGWWWGLGHFTAGLYWICVSLYVEPEKFAWLTPFALFLLPSIVGVYIGIVCAMTYKIKTTGVKKLLAFAVIFCAVEYARTFLFSGFPWNLIGYVWTVSDVTIQSAWLTGIYGLGFITVFVCAVPALFVLKQKPFLPNLAALLLLIALCVYGERRLEYNPAFTSNIGIRIVQADIPQEEKMDAGKKIEILKKYIALTTRPGLEKASVVIWPEAAIPFLVTDDSPLTRDLGSVLPSHTLLAVGGMRGEASADGWKVWNSLFVINHNGKFTAQYDKHHLVPFGEFIPLRNVLPLENISGGHGDFERGPGPSTLVTGVLPPFSPLICYEAIFPDEALDKTHKARWLLNITNDAWFGLTSGPYQHLQMARMRAVENNMPLVRAANTGVSAVIDPLGRIVASIPLEKVGIIDTYLPLIKP